MTDVLVLEPRVETTPRRERAVHLEGGLFGPDLLERLASGDLPGQKPADFGLPSGRALLDEIAAAYRDARDLWQVFCRRLERLPEEDPATSLTREGWVIPFLGLLGYELRYNPRAYDVGGVLYAISHRAGEQEDAPPVHIAGARRELGRVDPSGRPRLSPHALVQEFLNRSGHLWGIVTNGRTLRLLRDSTYVRRQAYVEFDLEAIFEAEGDARFEDFVLLYRLLHRSRLPQGTADAHECWLERYHQQALEQGNRARDRLRDGVEECLKILGTGFLRANPDWNPAPEALYQSLLRLVYRLLFLLVAEERGLLGGTDLYREHYSVSRLRRLVDRREAYTEHEDLWHALRVLFYLLRDPTPQVEGKPLASLLGLPVLDGGLFEPMELDNRTLTNRDLLEAFFHLVYYWDDEARTYRRVNYAALDVEELGSVYESLLDHQPAIQDRTFEFAAGMERKSTGSYYTPAELVTELIRSALEPVLEERLRSAKTREEKERAILSLRIVDPACGSGHFLLAAARRLGKELAKIRTGEEEPAPEQVREATREVIAHSIYGVDKNPLAVELCKVALWIESHTPGKPLTFLHHRIRCGDSLVGVWDLAVLKAGIPDEAYEPVGDDDRFQARTLKKRNAAERAGQRDLFAGDLDDAALRAALEVLEVNAIPDNSVEHLQEKARRYEALRASLEPLRRACHLWTASFFQRFKPGTPAITTSVLYQALSQSPVHGQVIGQAEALAARHRFFHWPLEFPEVFAEGGFDVVLSNPPWERIKLQEEEFFASCDPEIARAPTAAARKRLIAQLKETNPALWQAYQKALHDADATSKFLRTGGRYPLTGRGDINTYSVFAELAARLIRPQGRAGIVVPTGIATDATNKFFFANLVERGELVSLYDFENRKKLFPAVDSRMKFCLLTLRREQRIANSEVAMSDSNEPFAIRHSPFAEVHHSSHAEFAFFCHEAADLRDPERRFTLSPDDFRLLNPNTRTAPIFRSRRDAELTKHIYRRVPVLIEEAKGEAGNPWGVEFLAMFHMANDSHLFRTREELEAEGFRLEGNVFIRPVGAPGRAPLPRHTRGSSVVATHAATFLPLYEAKMIHQFDHRFGDYRDLPEGSRSTQLPEVPLERLADPNYQVLPRYWVPAQEVEARLAAKGWNRGWLLGWRDITNATNERTVIAAVIPRVGVGHTVPLFLTRAVFRASGLFALLNSLALDFVARQKVGGTHLTYNYLEQLPVLPPFVFDQPLPFAWEDYSPFAIRHSPPVDRSPTVADFIRPRVLELTYTAWDLKPFADDLWESADEAGRLAMLRQWEENHGTPADHSLLADHSLFAIRHSPFSLPPFRYDPERRFQLRCELDALFFLLYLGTPEQWEKEATPELKALFPTPRDAVAYILDQFPIVRRKDEERYGTYRTKEVILQCYDAMLRGMR